jgi:hypothetical protein
LIHLLVSGVQTQKAEAEEAKKVNNKNNIKINLTGMRIIYYT